VAALRVIAQTAEYLRIKWLRCSHDDYLQYI
jgi:hypothetical protein